MGNRLELIIRIKTIQPANISIQRVVYCRNKISAKINKSLSDEGETVKQLNLSLTEDAGVPRCCSIGKNLCGIKFLRCFYLEVFRGLQC